MQGSRALGKSPEGMHVLSWLKERGSITASQYDGALNQAQRTGKRAEEALLDVGALSEAELLKMLAGRYGTRFVSTERLSKADIGRATLDRIPRELAERLQVFPVVFEVRDQTLSVVVAAPGEGDVEKQVQVVSGVRSVRSYVGRPAAIAAAIAKFYGGQPRAFDELLGTGRRPDEVDPFDPLMGSARGGGLDPGGADFSDPFHSLMGPAAAGPSETRATAKISRPPRAATPVPTPAPAPRSPEPMVPAALPLDGTIPADFSFSAEPEFDLETYLETLNVFVSLLERERDELAGHSARVARVCRRVAERVGMSSSDRHALLVAAYLHDIGKTTAGFHLTPLNVARYEGHRAQAQRSRLAPIKLFETASLPAETKRILAHVYERFDGQGFPDHLAGKDIPYGARVLALVETYADLIANPRNPYRRVLTVPQALSVLEDLGGQLFDPTLAQVLVHLAVKDQERGVTAKQRALVVDPDPEETTILEMRLLERGFGVAVAHDLPAALERLEESVDLLVTEVDLNESSQGFALLERVNERPEAERPAVIFLTTRGDRDSVTRGFELGAADYLVKPASAEVVAAKASQVLEGAARNRASGVSGSLKEMSLPDVVQILSNGRRSGRLQITSAGQRGEVHFGDGQIHDATLGSVRGEDAFYAMLKLEEGTFSFDPTFAPSERRIETSPEGLLLEGMRRLDEGLV